MIRMVRRFFISVAFVVLVACGSRAFRTPDTASRERFFTLAVERERERVLPHLHYSLDAHSIDWGCGTIELSFFFIKEQGDSLLWVECVERIPMALIDTALCHRWFNYEHVR
jgi:hypothetical protein